MQLNLVHRGKPLALAGDDPLTLADLRARVSVNVSVPPENVRLIADGKLLPPEEDRISLSQLLRPSQTVIVLATKPETVESVRLAKPDTSLRPFEPKAPKYVATPRTTAQTPQKYGFGRVYALPNLPNSHQAQQILEQVASDRGFLSVMAKKRWNVGELREMLPEGRVGVDPVCVLGYNTNKGQQIHLRLRTDDMKGFRGISTIRQVLAHELAHNEFSEHDDDFKELMRWIEKTAARDDWRSQGHKLDNSWDAPDFGAGPSSVTRRAISGTGESKLGSESGSTGISRLLEEFKVGRTEPQSDSTEAERHKEKETESVARSEIEISEDEAWSGPKVFNSNGAGSSSRDTKGNSATTGLTELVSLGFSKELARVGLRENEGDASRAADWLFSVSGTRQRRGEMGEVETELTAKVQKGVNSLGDKLKGNEFVSVLDAMHMYVSNILRYPGVERFCRINSGNEGFQSRVGRFDDALEVLQVAGFRLKEGFWEFGSLDVSGAWIAKSLVQERLLEELMKDDSERTM